MSAIHAGPCLARWVAGAQNPQWPDQAPPCPTLSGWESFRALPDTPGAGVSLPPGPSALAFPKSE